MYITLDRLEDKGYLASRLADPTSVRGGRPKRYYRVLAAGERALREAFETSQALQQTAEPAWRFVKWPTKPLLEDSD